MPTGYSYSSSSKASKPSLTYSHLHWGTYNLPPELSPPNQPPALNNTGDFYARELAQL